jgi:hypothetical protein
MNALFYYWIKSVIIDYLSRFRGMMNTLQLAPLSSFSLLVQSGACCGVFGWFPSRSITARFCIMSGDGCGVGVAIFDTARYAAWSFIDRSQDYFSLATIRSMGWNTAQLPAGFRFVKKFFRADSLPSLIFVNVHRLREINTIFAGEDWRRTVRNRQAIFCGNLSDHTSASVAGFGIRWRSYGVFS